MFTKTGEPMPMHEQKNCPRCGQAFTCKAGSITQCECSTLALTREEQAWIEERFNDCLCISCLKEIKKEQMSGER
jgi:hypothetical protein